MIQIRIVDVLTQEFILLIVFILTVLPILSINVTSNNISILTTPTPWTKCGEGYCSCRLNKSNCYDHGKKLRFIPKFKDNIQYLLFEKNYLPKLTMVTFSNVSHLKLVHLSLIDNQIEVIDGNAFTQLTHIKEIDMSKNIGIKSLSNALKGLAGSPVSRIILKEMRLETLSSDDFAALTNTQLNLISLSGNRLKMLDFIVFAELNFLTSLQLNENLINLIKIRHLRNLVNLDLSDNYLQDTPIFCDGDNTSLLPNLRVLNLQRNHLSKLDDKSFLCLPQIRSLNVQGNILRNLGNNVLSSMPFLVNLNLSSIADLSTLTVGDFALNSSSLRNLMMEFNNVFMWKFDSKYLFKNCKNLKTLDLDGCSLPNNIEELFAPLKKLEELFLMLTNILNIPKTLLKTLLSLEYLDLSGNSIKSWDGKVVFGNSSSLRRLDLSANKITVINETSFPVHMRSKLQYIDLSGNPFSCTCDNFWFINWMKTSRITFKDRKYYICAYPHTMSKERRTLDDYRPTVEDCTEKNYVLIIIIPVLVVLIFGAVCSILVYKFRWQIRYKVYLIRKKGYKRSESDDRFSYDGFVIYSDEDRQWVHDIFLNELEKTEGFQLCIRLRDFDVGKVFVENIVENMDLSRKIILILTNHFAKDEWCRFQLLLAHHRIIEGDNNNVVLIIKEDIRGENLTSSLTTLLSTNSSITWSEDEPGSTLFWEKVKTYLR